MPYLYNTPEDQAAMLAAIGSKSIDELFAMVPADMPLKGPLGIPPAMSEMELMQHMTALACRNSHAGDKVCFLGGGSYDHFIPAVVDEIAGRGEFYTSYTPYQAEVSQGNLQVVFEYQTLIARLTGLDVSNASLYDGGSAAAEAVLMAVSSSKRYGKVVTAASVHPEYRQTIATYLDHLGVELVTVGTPEGVVKPADLAAAVDESTACVVVQQPNFFGCIEDAAALASIAHDAGALVVAAFDPISLGLLKRPGDWGADIAVAEGHTLGTPMQYGGPYLGIMACRENLVRRMPGRIAGQTVDRRGRRCFVLTLQTREQHIRREKATSNVCTNQGLFALRATIYLALLGPQGLRETANLCLQKSRYAAEQITKHDRFELAFSAPTLKEFVIRDRNNRVDELISNCLIVDYLAGVPLAPLVFEPKGLLSNCCYGKANQTRNRYFGTTPFDTVMKNSRDTKLLFELSATGRRSHQLPACDVPERPVSELLPAGSLAAAPPALPELSEPQVVRHFANLSQLNMSVDTHFYPLGSCTMKYNPKRNERVARMPGFSDLHPYQPEETLQGILQLLYDLQEYLQEISGLPACSLQPAAGAHGELTALWVAAAYFRDGGEKRTKVLVPDSAHGTNPASATMAGFETVTIKTTAAGTLDMDDFRRHLDQKIAVFMITNPNTVGIFEPRMREIADAVHKAGGLVYLDGANMNAILGIARPGDFGADMQHYNPHKTFSGPHGGGGPGAGPICVAEKLAPFLPTPVVVKVKGQESRDKSQKPNSTLTPALDPRLSPLDSYALDYKRPKSIGRVRAFFGNTGVLVRAYCYIRTHGPDGLRRVSENAVLNANYLLSRVKHFLPVPQGDRCMHEFVASAARLKSDKDISAMDLAKRLLDFGFHAPTVYFPLTVKEAIMVEPTETESKQTLDAFAETLFRITEEDADVLHNAPLTTPISRPDEVRAARQPVLVWREDDSRE